MKSFSPFGAVADECADTTVLIVGGTVSGTLESSDCVVPRFPVGVADQYKLSLATQSLLRVVTSGTGFQLRMEQLANQPSDDNLVFGVPVPQSTYVILPAGDYWMAMHSQASGATGPYTIQMQAAAAVNGCPINQNQQTYIYSGIVYNGSVATDDCPTTVQGLFGDNYWTWMVPTRTYQISATASIGLRLELTLCCSSTIPVRFASAGSGTVSMTFQPPAAGLYVINVIGNTLSSPTGPYTLRLTKQ